MNDSIDSKDICVCGHYLMYHGSLPAAQGPRGPAVCHACYQKREDWTVIHHEFKLDNLAYVQKIYDERAS